MDITTETNKYGELVLSTIHNQRLIRRKYLYYTEEQAKEHFINYLTFIN